MRKTHAIIIAVFFVAYAATFLPNFGIFNSLTWIGPLSLPMAWVIGLNALNTVLVIIVYRRYFRPYAERIAAEEKTMAHTETDTKEGIR
ncbi:hypothetical protein [Nesterenkonia jeotgali]|uniref:Type IV secretory pathway TrbL component n=1 Tax=Nesterenkonia jeotgali TaxID=317018 RepID=A0A839FPB8_9MICC|nr:hypothetical protein [Nesterenkonia jeotgali]MBA8921359.1 type IV secretory pathway TrbL component [Nesterenkonia jeotgali]